MRLNHQRSATSKKHQETEHHREKAASSNKRDMHRAAEDQTTWEYLWPTAAEQQQQGNLFSQLFLMHQPGTPGSGG